MGVNPVGCSGVNPKFVVICIGVVSTIAFISYVSLLFLNVQVTINQVFEEQFPFLVAFLVVMAIVSCLLIPGAVTKTRWLLLPYAFLSGIGTLLYMVYLVWTYVFVIHFSYVLPITICICLLQVWFLWIVIHFYFQAKSSDTNAYEMLIQDQNITSQPIRIEDSSKPTILTKLLRRNYK